MMMIIMCLSLETLTSIIHKDWLTYCGGTDRPGQKIFSGHKLCHNFSISDDLTQMINHSWTPPPPHTHTHTHPY